MVISLTNILGADNTLINEGTHVLTVSDVTEFDELCMDYYEEFDRFMLFLCDVLNGEVLTQELLSFRVDLLELIDRHESLYDNLMDAVYLIWGEADSGLCDPLLDGITENGKRLVEIFREVENELVSRGYNVTIMPRFWFEIST